MNCDVVKGPGDTTMFICGGRRRADRCGFCGKLAVYQCDFPVIIDGKKKSCDKWICEKCRTSQGPNIDFCPPHERNKVKIMEARLRGQVTTEFEAT